MKITNLKLIEMDLQKTYREAKEKAKELMKAGKISDYVNQLRELHKLNIELIREKRLGV